MPLTARRTALSSAAFGFQKRRTMTFLEAIALATESGRLALAASACFEPAGAAFGTDGAAAVVAPEPVLVVVAGALSPIAADCAASVFWAALAADCTAAPGAEWVVAPGSLAGTVVAAGGGAGAGGRPPPRPPQGEPP